jgi:prevent-host-death family protein
MKPRTIAAGEFKAKCLALMDEVQMKRSSITITKNGKPVACLVPAPLEGRDPIFGFFAGRGKIVGDITAPLYTDQEWEEFFENEAAKYNVPAKELVR